MLREPIVSEQVIRVELVHVRKAERSERPQTVQYVLQA